MKKVDKIKLKTYTFNKGISFNFDVFLPFQR